MPSTTPLGGATTNKADGRPRPAPRPPPSSTSSTTSRSLSRSRTESATALRDRPVKRHKSARVTPPSRLITSSTSSRERCRRDEGILAVVIEGYASRFTPVSNQKSYEMHGCEPGHTHHWCRGAEAGSGGRPSIGRSAPGRRMWTRGYPPMPERARHVTPRGCCPGAGSERKNSVQRSAVLHAFLARPGRRGRGMRPGAAGNAICHSVRPRRLAVPASTWTQLTRYFSA